MSSTFDNDPYYIPENNVFKATVVRAIAVKDENISEIITHTYFVHPEGANKYSLPIIALSMNEDLMFDYTIGTNNAGNSFDQWRSANPNDAAGLWSNANYWRAGEEFEHELNFSYFQNGEMIVNHGAGLRNHGNSTRSLPNRSWRLYARGSYGSSNFNHRFFNDQHFAAYKRLILRNSGNDTNKTMFRDGVVQQMVNHLNFATQAYQPCIVFLNGEYWGIYNIRERFDDHYFNRTFGVDGDDLDYLENNALVEEGSNTHYLNFLQTLEETDMSTEEAYTYLERNMDIQNYHDYYISSIFSANYDWPNNNIVYWRKRTPDYVPDAPYGHDGRWRWVMKDMDVAFNGNTEWIRNAATFNMLDHSTNLTGINGADDHGEYTFLFRTALENPRFKNEFVNRFADLLNTTFLTERVLTVIDEHQAILDGEIEEHIERWSMIEDKDTWLENVEVMREFARARPEFQRQHIQQQFDIEGLYNLTVSPEIQEAGYITVNTIDILPTTVGVSENPYPWTGLYFSDIPLKIKANAYEGYVFTHWSGASESTEAEIEITSNSLMDIELVAHYTIEASLEDHQLISYKIYPNPATDILQIETSSNLQAVRLFTIDGRMIMSSNESIITTSHLNSGLYLIELTTDHGKVVSKVMIR